MVYAVAAPCCTWKYRGGGNFPSDPTFPRTIKSFGMSFVYVYLTYHRMGNSTELGSAEHLLSSFLLARILWGHALLRCMVEFDDINIDPLRSLTL